MTIIRHIALSITLLTTLPALSMEKCNFDYLSSEPFKQRLEKAAEWVNDCPLIIEIGGGHNSIDKYIKHREVIVIDPELKNRNYGLVTHIGQRFQWWKEDPITQNKAFAVIIMGLQLEGMNGGDWQKLFNLIDRSQKTVIEYSAAFPVAKNQFKNISAAINKTITKEKEFDFSSDFTAQSNVPIYRKMVLFENAEKQALAEAKNAPSTSLEISESNDDYKKSAN